MEKKLQSLMRVVGWLLFSLVSLIVLNAVLLKLLFLGAENHFGVSENDDPSGFRSVCACSLLLPLLPVINILFLGIFTYPSYKKNARPAIDVLLAPIVETGHPRMILLLWILAVGLLVNSLFFTGIYTIFKAVECAPGSDADCGMAAGVALVVLGPTLLTIFILMNGMLLLFALHISFRYGRQGQKHRGK